MRWRGGNDRKEEGVVATGRKTTTVGWKGATTGMQETIKSRGESGSSYEEAARSGGEGTRHSPLQQTHSREQIMWLLLIILGWSHFHIYSQMC